MSVRSVPELAVRPDWLTHVVREVQLAAGTILPDSQAAPSTTEVLHRLRCRIPPAANSVETYLLAGLLAVAERNLETGRAAEPLSSAVRLARLLTDRYAERWANSQLARTIGMSRSRLEAEFRREFSVSIHQYLTLRRIDEAKRLLVETTDKVEAIAGTVGYRSKRAFYTAFERTTGLSPAKFRMQP